MPKFKEDDRVRVCLETASPYRGRIGVVNGKPSQDSNGYSYEVKFENKGLRTVYRFIERDLEAVN